MINTLSIIIGNTLSIIIVAILMLNLPYGYTRESISARIFAWISIPIVLGALFGMGSAFFDGLPGVFNRIMVIICGSAGIIMPLLVSFAFWLYIESTGLGSLSSIKIRITIASIPIVIICVLLIVNLFVPLLFSVSPENVYERGPLGLISYILGPLYLFVALIRFFYIKSKKRGLLFVSLVGIIVPIAVVGYIQVTSYGIIQSWMGFAIGMISFYIGLQKDMLYTDSMTGAFNRVYLDYILDEAKAKNTPLGGIMIDIDHFKSINDTLGHGTGDIIIKKTASALRASTDNNSNVIRLGGDEFMVVSYTDSSDHIDTLIERIRHYCDNINNKNTLPAKIELSMGSALYDPSQDNSSDWLNSMDKRMYQEKAIHRMNSGVDRRRR